MSCTGKTEVSSNGTSATSAARSCSPRSFLQAKSVAFTQSDIDTIAAHDMGAALTNPHIKVAVVAAQPEVIDLVRRYMKAAALAYPTSIFSTMAEARAWVAAPMAGGR
jgi:hypothetical protein